MKNIVAAVVVLLATQVAAYADPIIVVRPAIGAGSAGVLPQNAFAAAPANPSTPAPPVTVPTPPVTAPAPSVIFTSTGYSANLPVRKFTTDLNAQREYHTPGYLDGVYYCGIVDDSGKTLSSKLYVSYYPGAGSNTPAILLQPLKTGMLRLVMKCGPSSSNASPVEKFEVTVE